MTYGKRRIVSGILIALSFIIEGFCLSEQDHQGLFHTLQLASIIAGVSVWPVDTTKHRSAKLIASIAILGVITMFILVLAVMNL